MVAFLLWRPIHYRGERGLARNVQPRMMAFSAMSEEEDDMDMMVCGMSAPPPALPVMDTATAEVKITLELFEHK